MATRQWLQANGYKQMVASKWLHHRQCILQSWCGGMSKTPRWWFETTTTTAGAEDQVGGPKNDDDGTANGPRGGRKKRRQEDSSHSGHRGCHTSHGTRWSLRCSYERQRPTSAGVRFGTLFLHQFGTAWIYSKNILAHEVKFRAEFKNKGPGASFFNFDVVFVSLH